MTKDIKFRWLGLALLLLGCGMDEDALLDSDIDLSAESDSETEATGEVPAELGVLGAGAEDGTQSAPIVACPGARLIGILDDPSYSCELDNMPPQWKWKPMFEGGSPEVSWLWEPVPSDLQRFCIYTWDGQFPALVPDYQPMFDAIEVAPTMQLHSVAPDCMGEAGQADLQDVAVGNQLRDAFHRNIDRVMAADLGGTEPWRVDVDVAVIDTVPAWSSAAVNEHGFQMEGIIDDIACPSGTTGCAAQTRQVLAMPRENWASPPDWWNGGSHGTQGDVALAIYVAVQSWRQNLIANPLSAPPRLVLNLSLGWDRNLPDTVDPLRGPHHALKSVLQFAACEGVLVFAAAGNNPVEGCPAEHVDALGPANFEAQPMLTPSECAALGFPTSTSGYPVFGTPLPYEPLLHAVGGVDELDAPLLNARQNGEPRLVALGANGSSNSGLGSGSREALTGTSVSTAVASGTAALIWSYRPALRPHEVVEILYNSGWVLGRNADFGLGVPMGTRRISTCASLANACVGQPPWMCPALTCVAAGPALEGDLGPFFTEVEGIMTGPNVIDSHSSGLSGTAPLCVGDPWDNLADPQPEEPLCPHCNINIPPGTGTGDDEVRMTLGAGWAPLISALKLVTYDSGRNPLSYSLDPSVVISLQDPTVDVTSVFVDAPNTVSATLEFTLVDGRTQSNPIPVSFR